MEPSFRERIVYLLICSFDESFINLFDKYVSRWGLMSLGLKSRSSEPKRDRVIRKRFEERIPHQRKLWVSELNAVFKNNDILDRADISIVELDESSKDILAKIDATIRYDKGAELTIVSTLKKDGGYSSEKMSIRIDTTKDLSRAEFLQRRIYERIKIPEDIVHVIHVAEDEIKGFLTRNIIEEVTRHLYSGKQRVENVHTVFDENGMLRSASVKIRSPRNNVKLEASINMDEGIELAVVKSVGDDNKVVVAEHKARIEYTGLDRDRFTKERFKSLGDPIDFIDDILRYIDAVI